MSRKDHIGTEIMSKQISSFYIGNDFMSKEFAVYRESNFLQRPSASFAAIINTISNRIGDRHPIFAKATMDKTGFRQLALIHPESIISIQVVYLFGKMLWRLEILYRL
ncbi:MAG TPA: hypothetical protein VMV47_18165 [Bacteroidales bacterium]|nr:hypothetical protein [Bacteroidales bacterium]